MIESSYSLYKLIVLYMLKKVNFPLTNAQISDFILGQEYTSYFHLQQVLTEILLPPVTATEHPAAAQPRDAVLPLAAQASEGKNVAEASGACKRENLPL